MNNYINPMSINQYGFGSWIKKTAKKGLNTAKKVGQKAVDLGHDGLLMTTDNLLGVVGAGSVIDSSSYRTGFMGKVTDITSESIAPIVGQVAANAVAPGIGGQLMGGLQQGVGAATAQPMEQGQAQQQAVNLGGSSAALSALNTAMNSPINPATQGWVGAYGGFVNNKLAEGGEINPTKINVFNNGGTHEENPHGGIPLGYAEDGAMNTVEEGEVSIEIDKNNKYIFSDRLVYE